MQALRRDYCQFVLAAALVAASLVWAFSVSAEEPTAPKSPPATPPEQQTKIPNPFSSINSVPLSAQVIKINPCEDADPPPYCNAAEKK